MKMKHLIIITVLSLVLFMVPACNQLENVTNSGSKLLLWSLAGIDSQGNEVNPVISDVVTEGTVFNDNAQATVSAVLLDPLKSVVDTTFYQSVIIDQVDIKYTRADGLNVEGKDVPYAFSQRVHMQLVAGATSASALTFLIVQHNSKRESPLVELTFGGQEHMLKLEAEVTFHAKDVAGNRLEPVTGYISVWCANFAD